ncbi:hypothetical protein FRB90_009657 [Tulasnella sp. 427]|nr:hypothetical protein FRB90_009657 [Tulasnella sp. 427]
MPGRPEPEPRARTSGIQRKRPRSNVEYLPWNVQERIKKRRVEEMKMRSSYLKERKKAFGTGANAGVFDSGWPRKSKAPVAGEGDEVESPEQPEAMALDADRQPTHIPSPLRKPKKEPKQQTGLIRTSVTSTTSSPPLKNFQETSADPKHRGDKSLDPDGLTAPANDGGPSFRELKRKAYSRESLHTYRNRSAKDKPGEGRRKSDPVHKGRGGSRGQPNMKLRMGVMLEQIKRVSTS